MNHVAAAYPLPPASILGMGAVTPLGRNLDAMVSSLRQAPNNDATLRVTDDLSDPAINSQIRRADRFSKMAILAAIDAWNSSVANHGTVAGERVGLILSSGFGPHGRGFKFLDGILDNGDAAASPTDFSHSVHGAASAYISRMLGIQGPSLPLTDFELGFEHAVLLAQSWLHEGTCDRVLIGAVEELGDVMLHCASVILKDSPEIRPGEGAVFFVLGAAGVPGVPCLSAADVPTAADLLIIEHPPMPTSATPAIPIRASQTVSFAPYFGHSASGVAFDVLGGLLSLQAGCCLGQSIARTPSLSRSSARIDNVCTFRASSDALTATLVMTRALVNS